jgi:hypothetical protein
MLTNILKRFALSKNTNTAPQCIDMATCPSNTLAEFVAKSQDIQSNLRNFVGDRQPDSTFVALGENCSSAWYLKQIGLKKASYPFDWTFSSPEIVLDCINDRFDRYLKRELIEPKSNGSAGHKYYHSSFFNHRNPLNSQNDYCYYERCCHRFLRVLQSENPVYYLITLINEPSKRPGWANGFSGNFPMPVRHGCNSIMPLFDKLKHLNQQSRLIAIEHYTESDRESSVNQINSDMMHIVFNASGVSTGVFYRDYLDDFCFKLFMTGLHGFEKQKSTSFM